MLFAVALRIEVFTKRRLVVQLTAAGTARRVGASCPATAWAEEWSIAMEFKRVRLANTSFLFPHTLQDGSELRFRRVLVVEQAYRLLLTFRIGVTPSPRF